MINRLLTSILLAAIGHAGPALSLAHSAEDAVILMYHHVDTSTPPATSTTPEQFAAHLDYLARENFTVLPLLDVLTAIKSGLELPEKTVGAMSDHSAGQVPSSFFFIHK